MKYSSAEFVLSRGRFCSFSLTACEGNVWCGHNKDVWGRANSRGITQPLKLDPPRRGGTRSRQLHCPFQLCTGQWTYTAAMTDTTVLTCPSCDASMAVAGGHTNSFPIQLYFRVSSAHLMARHSFSTVEYLVSLGKSLWLIYRIRLHSSPYLCNKMAPRPKPQAPILRHPSGQWRGGQSRGSVKLDFDTGCL